MVIMEQKKPECPEYDPVIRITAGELRALGLNLPENIPDCGHVSRTAIRHVASTEDPIKLMADGAVQFGIDVFIDEPFCWVELNVTATRMADE